MAAKRKSDEASGSSEVKKTKGHWSGGLLASMDDPDLLVEADDRVVIIKDKYPKAKYHFLVMPKETIRNLKSLTKEHMDLLEHVQQKGEEIADKANKDIQFRFGYHAVPSMSHLHMHVISQDFDSPSLKNKKHWNSFTSKYFVDSEDIIKQLKSSGQVDAMDSSRAQELLKRDLRCHVCKKDISTIPALKTHIQIHNYKKKS